MFTRRKSRNIASNVPLGRREQNSGFQDRPVANPEPVTSEMLTVVDPGEAMDVGQQAANGGEKTKVRRLPVPIEVRRKKRNKHLARIVAPKSALMLLNELKPGVKFTVQFTPNSKPINAEAVYEDEVIGEGSGLSKSAAKNAAAEAALKKMVHSILSKSQNNNGAAAAAEPQPEVKKEDGDEDVEMQEDNPSEQLPWAGLASFALYRLFKQWHDEGVPLGALSRTPGIPRPAVSTVTYKDPVPLPPNAAEMHPVSLLNQLYPGIQGEILNRQLPQGAVTVGYRFNDKTFVGTASNAKAARKEAAKALLLEVYGLKFED